MPGSCTSAEVTTFYDDCLNQDPGDGTCDDSEIGATCYACLVSQPTDSTWGPVIEYTVGGLPSWQSNLAGCLSVEGVSKTCVTAVEEVSQCENDSCNGSCKIATSNEQTAYTECTSNADTDYCSSYVSADNSACGSISSSIQTTCAAKSTSTFEQQYTATAKVLCE